MIRHSARRAPLLQWCLAVSLCWSAGALHSAHADWAAAPYAAEDIEHNSNIFDLPRGDTAPVGHNGPTFGDTSFETRAGIDGTYMLDRQKFFGTAEFRRFEYDNFTLLDHNELLFDGGLNWKVGREFDGLVDYRHEQRMVPYLDLASYTQLVLETDNVATATFNVNVAPEWRLETRAKDHQLNSPRIDIPGLSLHDDAIREGLRYLGVSNLSAGAEAEYTERRYTDDPTAATPDFHQESLALAANYIVSGYTNFAGNAGYTRRFDPTHQNFSGGTGSLAYVHSVTGKTAISLQLSRAINSYISTAGNEIDTTAFAVVTWQATYKLAVKLGGGYTLSKYPQIPESTVLFTRVDHFELATAEVQYQLRRWLTLRPYAQYQTRSSNQSVFAFNATQVGFELIAKPLLGTPLTAPLGPPAGLP